jgi:hypothetical protein
VSRDRSRTPGRRANARDVPLRTHWLVLCTLVVTLAVALVLQGYSRHMFNDAADGTAAPPGPSASVPATVAHGGPVVAAAGDRPHTARRTRHTPPPSQRMTAGVGHLTGGDPDHAQLRRPGPCGSRRPSPPLSWGVATTTRT